MAPTINVSDRVLEHLKGLGVSYELVETPKPVDTQEQTAIDYQINPSDFIILEGKSGKDSYPDLWVCKYRLGTDSAVENAGERIEARIKDSAREKNGRAYAGNINREQALKLNLLLGGRTLNTRQAKDFFSLLLFGKAFDGKGERVSKLGLSEIADEIFGVRGPYRAEWFEDYFIGQQDNLTLNKNYVLQGDELVPEYSRSLTTCLMDDRTPGIEVEGWLRNSTAQGFPRKNTKSGKLWYWHPRANRAARFGAGPVGASFGCYWDPRGTYAVLGVRHVREAPRAEK